MGVIYFGRKASSDYGIVVEKPPNYTYPERDYDIYHIPGKNGDIIIDKGSYRNVSRTYDIAVGSLSKDFTEMAVNISKWLHTPNGYSRLEDTYEPEFYRIAMYKEECDIENILAHGGRASITFDCKPQRYLKSGESTYRFTSTGRTITNPTNYPSLPVITVHKNGAGTGRVGIGGYIVDITKTDATTVIIDSEAQEAYYSTENLNPYVKLSKGFPVLSPGVNQITFGGDVSSITIKPNWWQL